MCVFFEVKCLLGTVKNVVYHRDTDFDASELLNDTLGYRAPWQLV